MPFTESFDNFESLLAHFSRPPESLSVASEVDVVRKLPQILSDVNMYSQNAGGHDAEDLRKSL